MVVEGLRDAIIFGWRFGSRCTRYVPNFRQLFRLRTWLSNKYRWRCHVGRRGGAVVEKFNRVGMPSFWNTDAVVSDYSQANGPALHPQLEEQCNQRKTHHCKKGENWHCLSHSL